MIPIPLAASGKLDVRSTTAYVSTCDTSQLTPNAHGAGHTEVWGYEYAESMDTFEVSKPSV